MYKTLVVSVLILSLLGAGCTVVAQAPPESVIQTAIAQTQIAAPTSTDSPTASPAATNSPQPSSTPSPAPSPTPTLDFAGTVVTDTGYLPSGNLMVAIQAPFALTGQYRALIGEDKFACLVLPADTRQLYCVGPAQTPGKHTIQVFFLEGEEMLFALEFIVPGASVTVPEPVPGFEVEVHKIRVPTKEPPSEPTSEPPPEDTPEPYPYPYPGPA